MWWDSPMMPCWQAAVDTRKVRHETGSDKWICTVCLCLHIWHNLNCPHVVKPTSTSTVEKDSSWVRSAWSANSTVSQYNWFGSHEVTFSCFVFLLVCKSITWALFKVSNSSLWLCPGPHETHLWPTTTKGYGVAVAEKHKTPTALTDILHTGLISCSTPKPVSPQRD